MNRRKFLKTALAAAVVGVVVKPSSASSLRARCQTLSSTAFDRYCESEKRRAVVTSMVGMCVTQPDDVKPSFAEFEKNILQQMSNTLQIPERYLFTKYHRA